MSQAADARALFAQLLPAEWVDALDPPRADATYTPHVVVGLMVYQRCHAGASLADAVAAFVADRPGGPALSANTGGYSRARTRLRLPTAEAVADRVTALLLAATPPARPHQPVFVLDGTTLSLPSTPELRRAYPPASNQHGRSHWPVLHAVTAHELVTGLAVRPEFGAMYGPDAVGEGALAARLLARLPAGCLLIGDRNFGVFAVAHAVRASGRDVLVRLTAARAAAVLRAGEADGPGRWRVRWAASRYERRRWPDLPAEAAVDGWVCQVPAAGGPVWVFTTADAPPAEVGEWYRRRWRVETDLRDLKQTLALDRPGGKGVAVVGNEVVLGVVAFNLVNQVRRLAAATAGVEPRRLSFAGTWSLVKAVLGAVADGLPAAEWERRFDALLRWAGQRKLPHRPAGRSAPRTVLPRRRKFPTRDPVV